MKKGLTVIIVIIALSVASLIVADHVITGDTSGSMYDDAALIPYNRTGLLLGTSRFVRGRKNRYFYNRISAAEKLIRSGRIEYIVISGDNRKKNYNEPQDMKDELIKDGIPEGKIFLDYAGFRTYDSVYRMNGIFRQKSFTVISQKFHNERAVYIARSLGLNAIGYNAADVSRFYGFKTRVREKFARVKVFIDLAIGKKPRFLGEPVEIK